MKRLWIVFIAVFVFSFTVLGWVGSEIFRQAPPIPREVVTTDGRTVIAAGDISNWQNVWQAMGGMQVGSIWGHGSNVAPDWTADYLHREALYILEKWANAEFTKDYGALNSEQQALLRQRLQDTLRRNNYDAQTGRLTIEPVRAEVFELPIGLLQTYRSVAVGYWSARSPEFMQTGVMQLLRWMRIVGDMVFGAGAVAFVYFALDLIFRKLRLREAVVTT
jgi:nitric oxide reductase subunit B